jgi:carbonic anhydrase
VQRRIRNAAIVCLKSQLLILALWMLAAQTISLAQEAPQSHWTYKGPSDPKHWGELDPAFASCANGHHQSPINITGAKRFALTPD